MMAMMVVVMMMMMMMMMMILVHSITQKLRGGGGIDSLCQIKYDWQELTSLVGCLLFAESPTVEGEKNVRCGLGYSCVSIEKFDKYILDK